MGLGGPDFLYTTNVPAELNASAWNSTRFDDTRRCKTFLYRRGFLKLGSEYARFGTCSATRASPRSRGRSSS
eukprot:7768861-Pyramimonas_sp.AAC.1